MAALAAVEGFHGTYSSTAYVPLCIFCFYVAAPNNNFYRNVKQHGRHWAHVDELLHRPLLPPPRKDENSIGGSGVKEVN